MRLQGTTYVVHLYRHQLIVLLICAVVHEWELEF